MKRITQCTIALSLLSAVPALAQTVTGAVRGTVTDPSGAIVSGATITITNVATNVSVTLKSDSAGVYSQRNLQIGQYKLTVDAPGFSNSSFGPFSLEIDQTAKIDVALTVGGSNTTVEVTDQLQPILQTENATTGETFTQNTINSIPLNGRDFSQLTVFTPGAVSTNYQAYGGSNSTERATGADTSPNVNGNRQQSNNFLLDGQEINENLNNTIGYNPSPDSLDQIRVISANANAEFGNVNGGDVVSVMKSGTNSLHGSVFGFLENWNLNANSWGNNFAGISRDQSNYTQTIYGGTLGGPIIKDKLFFFVDYEGFRRHDGGTAAVSVAPAAFRGIGTNVADFSALYQFTKVVNGVNVPAPIQLYNTQAPGGPVQYAGNQVPITNPIALYLFSHPEAYPLPNRTVPDGVTNNYFGPTRTSRRNDQGDVKIDYHLHQKDVISARYSQGVASDIQTQVPIAVQFPGGSDYPDHLFTVNETHTFSPSIVNLARASYSRIRFNSGVSVDPSGIFGFNGNSLVGISSPAQQTQGFSQQNFSNGSGLLSISGVGVNPTPEIFIDNVFEYADDLTVQKGKHLLKFGAQVTRYQQNSFYPGNNGELGYQTYTGQFTTLPGASNTYGFSDFVTNHVYEAAVGQVVGRTGQRQYRDAFYAQDDWKVMSNLTLNLGLRWEYSQPIYEVNNKEANLNLTPGLSAADTIQYAGQNGNSRALYDPVYTNFMPRIGFAFQPQQRMVIRGGYGITNYLEGTGANLRLTQNPPFHNDFDTIATIPNGSGATYNPGTPLTAETGFPINVAPTTTFYAWRKNLRPASIQEFTVGVEYQLTNTSTITASYVGETGHHLTDPVYANQATAPGVVAPYFNIVGQNGVVKVTASDSASNYNSLQATFRQRLTAGLEFTANYTYAKSLTDDIGYYGTTGASQQYYQQDAYNLQNEWGPAGQDIRHAISATGTYAIPFGRGRKYGANTNAILDEALGGWKVSGSNVTYTGFPITITSPANYSNLVQGYTGAARPNQLRPVHITNQKIQHWFGTDPSVTQPCAFNDAGALVDNGVCAYSPQPLTSFGNVRPGTLRAPGFLNFDFSAQKAFTVFHENRVDFRADFFNALNIASYGNPDSGITDPNFGQITGVKSNPRTIQFEAKYVF